MPCPGGRYARSYHVTDSGIPPCTGVSTSLPVPGEDPAGRTGVPHLNSGPPRGHSALLNPWPTQPRQPWVVLMGSGLGPPPTPWLPHLLPAGLSRTGRLDHLHPTNQSLSSGLSPQEPGDWLRLPTQSQRTRASHPSASLCHVAFPPRAGPLSSLSIPGHLSLQPSKRASKKGSPCQHLRWEVMRSKLYFGEICSPRQNLDQVG